MGALDAGYLFKKQGKERWKVIKQIGKGTFSRIYVAEDLKRGMEVAVKVVSKSNCTNLAHEYKILKMLHGCPVVCKRYYFGYQDNYAYIVMELLQTGSLSKVREEGRSPRLAGMVGLEMLRCIRIIHSLGIIHRDIKPSNFGFPAKRRRPYECRILDFGLSRVHIKNGQIEAERKKTSFRGCILYASHNAHVGKDLGRRDDLWSLFYVLIDLSYEGGMPWKRELAKTSKERAYKWKKAFLQSEKPQFKAYFQKFPPMALFKQHLMGLKYGDKPNYEFIEELLKCLAPEEATDASLSTIERSSNLEHPSDDDDGDVDNDDAAADDDGQDLALARDCNTPASEKDDNLNENIADSGRTDSASKPNSKAKLAAATVTATSLSPAVESRERGEDEEKKKATAQEQNEPENGKGEIDKSGISQTPTPQVAGAEEGVRGTGAMRQENTLPPLPSSPKPPPAPLPPGPKPGELPPPPQQVAPSQTLGCDVSTPAVNPSQGQTLDATRDTAVSAPGAKFLTSPYPSVQQVKTAVSVNLEQEGMVIHPQPPPHAHAQVENTQQQQGSYNRQWLWESPREAPNHPNQTQGRVIPQCHRESLMTQTLIQSEHPERSSQGMQRQILPPQQRLRTIVAPTRQQQPQQNHRPSTSPSLPSPVIALSQQEHIHKLNAPHVPPRCLPSSLQTQGMRVISSDDLQQRPPRWQNPPTVPTRHQPQIQRSHAPLQQGRPPKIPRRAKTECVYRLQQQTPTSIPSQNSLQQAQQLALQPEHELLQNAHQTHGDQRFNFQSLPQQIHTQFHTQVPFQSPRQQVQRPTLQQSAQHQSVLQQEHKFSHDAHQSHANGKRYNSQKSLRNQIRRPRSKVKIIITETQDTNTLQPLNASTGLGPLPAASIPKAKADRCPSKKVAASASTTQKSVPPKKGPPSPTMCSTLATTAGPPRSLSWLINHIPPKCKRERKRIVTTLGMLIRQEAALFQEDEERKERQARKIATQAVAAPQTDPFHHEGGFSSSQEARSQRRSNLGAGFRAGTSRWNHVRDSLAGSKKKETPKQSYTAPAFQNFKGVGNSKHEPIFLDDDDDDVDTVGAPAPRDFCLDPFSGKDQCDRLYGQSQSARLPRQELTRMSRESLGSGSNPKATHWDWESDHESERQIKYLACRESNDALPKLGDLRGHETRRREKIGRRRDREGNRGAYVEGCENRHRKEYSDTAREGFVNERTYSSDEDSRSGVWKSRSRDRDYDRRRRDSRRRDSRRRDSRSRGKDSELKNGQSRYHRSVSRDSRWRNGGSRSSSRERTDRGGRRGRYCDLGTTQIRFKGEVRRKIQRDQSELSDTEREEIDRQRDAAEPRNKRYRKARERLPETSTHIMPKVSASESSVYRNGSGKDSLKRKRDNSKRSSQLEEKSSANVRAPERRNFNVSKTNPTFGNENDEDESSASMRSQGGSMEERCQFRFTCKKRQQMHVQRLVEEIYIMDEDKQVKHKKIKLSRRTKDQEPGNAHSTQAKSPMRTRKAISIVKRKHRVQ